LINANFPGNMDETEELLRKFIPHFRISKLEEKIVHKEDGFNATYVDGKVKNVSLAWKAVKLKAQPAVFAACWAFNYSRKVAMVKL